jgi:hypothetical protein
MYRYFIAALLLGFIQDFMSVVHFFKKSISCKAMAEVRSAAASTSQPISCAILFLVQYNAAKF